MTAEIVDDLKQFIQAALVQQTSDIVARLDAHDLRFDGIDRRLDTLESRLNDEVLRLDTVIDTFGAMLVKHDTRITKLEAKTV